MWTTVATFQEPGEAHMFCDRLHAEGVPAIIAHEYHIATAWYLSQALGGVKVQVPDDRQSDARTIAALCDAGAFRPVLEDTFGALDDIACPHCGARTYRKIHPLSQATLAILIFLLFWVPCPPQDGTGRCNKCGQRFALPPHKHISRLAIAITAAAAGALGGLLLLLYALHQLGLYRIWPILVVMLILLGGFWAKMWQSAGDR